MRPGQEAALSARRTEIDAAAGTAEEGFVNVASRRCAPPGLLDLRQLDQISGMKARRFLADRGSAGAAHCRKGDRYREHKASEFENAHIFLHAYIKRSIVQY